MDEPDNDRIPYKVTAMGHSHRQTSVKEEASGERGGGEKQGGEGGKQRPKGAERDRG